MKDIKDLDTNDSLSPIVILSKDDNAVSFIDRRGRGPNNHQGKRENVLHTRIIGELMGTIRSIGELQVRVQRKRTEISRSLNLLLMKNIVCRMVIGKVVYFGLVEDVEKWKKNSNDFIKPSIDDEGKE